MDFTAIKEQRGFLAAFGYRNYRYIWGSDLAMATAFSIEMVVTGWIVLELTDSPSLVGLVAACRFAGMGLGPFLGTLADLFERRRILIWTRVASGIFALILAVLYYTLLIEVWHIFILVFLSGIVRVFSMIAIQAVLPDTVESHNLTNAVGMKMVGMNIMFMVGPLMGGYLYDHTGAGTCFAIMATTHLLSSLLIFPLRLPTREKPTHQESVWKSLIIGFHYIKNDRALLSLMVMSAVANFFAWPCVVSIMPVFARDVLHVGASDLGWLLSAEGLGGLIGALVLSLLGRFSRKGRIPVLALITWSVVLVVLAGLQSFPVSLGLLVGVGICRSLTFATFHVLCLTWATEEFRARVWGIYTFSIGTSPFGSIFLGFTADLWESDIAIIGSASASILLTILIAFWVPELHRRR